MKNTQLLTISAIILFVLGAVMVYLGINGSILPPTITGVGFWVIGFVFLKMRE